MKLLIALALVASVSAYDECPKCRNAAAAAGVSNCAFETTSNCGCNGGCGALDGVNSFRISDCSLDTCADAARRLAETTTDLEEAAQSTSQWGRRRRRFFDNRRRRRRFFDNRRRRRRTNYPTPFPTPSPTGILAHKTCKYTTCSYSAGQTTVYSAYQWNEKFHCEKVGAACRCVCDPSGRATKCAIRHHHTTGYKKTFTHC
jgi:hypothetical protein